MEPYRVSFIGHREIDRLLDVDLALEATVRRILCTREYVECYMGRNGEYDILTASVIKRVRRALARQNCTMNLVLPYHVKDEEYYADYYDDIFYPLEKTTHYKTAITKRNEWMMDHSDLLIAYVETAGGGAYTAVQYAKRKGVHVINIADQIL